MDDRDWFTIKAGYRPKSNKTKVTVFPSRKGEDNSNSSITKETAIKIKYMLKSGVKQTDIAKELGLTKHVVQNIKRGLSWGHI